MKLNELKEVIRREVKEAIREELKDIMVEAITIASTPATTTPSPYNASQVESKTAPTGKIKPIQELLEETRLNFNSSDAQTFQTSDMRQEMAQAFNPNLNTASMASKLGMIGGKEPGLDLNSLPFLKNAKKILDVSNEKDKLRQLQ